MTYCSALANRDKLSLSIDINNLIDMFSNADLLKDDPSEDCAWIKLDDLVAVLELLNVDVSIKIPREAYTGDGEFIEKLKVYLQAHKAIKITKGSRESSSGE